MQANAGQALGPKGEVRGFLSFFGLHMVTLGFYSFYWWFKVAGEVNAFLGQERMSAMKLLLLSPITCGIYMLIWEFSEGPKIIKEIQAKAGLPQNAPWFVGPWQFQRELNKVWEATPG